MGQKTSFWVCRNDAVVWSLSTERAVLVSSKAMPVLDLELIPSKTGEAPAFRAMFRRVADTFSHAFVIVIADAGLTSRENALLVRGAMKHYLFALKGSQPLPRLLAVVEVAN